MNRTASYGTLYANESISWKVVGRNNTYLGEIIKDANGLWYFDHMAGIRLTKDEMIEAVKLIEHIEEATK